MSSLSKASAIANSAIEALKQAYQENPDYRTGGMILAALAMVTQMREELSGIRNDSARDDSATCCFPV